MTHSSDISRSGMVMCLTQNVKTSVNIFWMPSDKVCDLSLFSIAFVMLKRDTPDQKEKNGVGLVLAHADGHFFSL